MAHPPVPIHERIEVRRWPSETPLFVFAVLVSLVLWVVATVSIVGLFYAVIFGVLFFVMHLAFIAHVRGNAVRLGPDQFPELHSAVVRMARRVGLEPVPDVYLMQAGGALNAFAARFLGRNLVVLFSDLLEACGTNTGARDMIIAHELGHVRAGHLRWHWVLLPANLIPFLGQALSRAREYTCDRYGLAGAGSPDQALLGLAILSAGAKHGPLVNRRAFVAQRSFLESGWMTIGTWLATHPPLSQRMVALDPTLAGSTRLRWSGTLRAIAIIGVILLPVGLAGWMGASKFTRLVEETKRKAEQNAQQTTTEPSRGSRPARTAAEARRDSVAAVRRLEVLGAFLGGERRSDLGLPASSRELSARWMLKHTGQAIPRDPYDGEQFGYLRTGDRFVIWSSGPDGESETDDDIVWRSQPPAGTH
ncbi:MAG: M48 family metallopeptidase [Gemmatimonadales bacterium]